VNVIGLPVDVPVAFVALIAAQYLVLAVRPVRLTDTLWKFPSLDPSVTGVVAVGVPLVPKEVHQVEVAGA
jgi:hypothetical protein